eukprot:c25205_g1_i1 orf=197-1453(+)
MATPGDAVCEKSEKGKYVAYVVCGLLGMGSLFPWNSMLTIEDYYSYIFPHYHPARVFTLAYQPFAFITIVVLTYNEARINTRLRILFGLCLFFLCTLFIPILDLATSGHGGIGPYVGVCIASGLLGVADAHVQGGMTGDLSFTQAEFLQSFSAGLAASGAATSGLRLVTKAAFENSRNGLRKGALAFFFISSFFVLMCIVLYAYVFPRLDIVKYYRSKAASEGAKTVTADLVVAGVTSEGIQDDMEDGKVSDRLTSWQLLIQNIDLALAIFIVYALTLSIFPGFLAEDTGQHELGSWYAVTLIAMYNGGDLISRYIPLIDMLRMESRLGLLAVAVLRFAFIPVFYFTANYGTEGWMVMLCIVLGLSNGYLTVCILVTAPKGYKGPEQNALGNLIVLFLLGGIFSGAALDWLWLIGKGW